MEGAIKSAPTTTNNSGPQGNTTVNNNYMQETEKTKKISAIENNQKIILTSEAEIKEYINNSINRTTAGVTVAYGKVNERLSNDVKIYSNGKINIKDNFLEIVPYDIQHSYEQHHIAKEKRNMYFGAITNTVKKQIENDVNSHIFKEKQYAFVISYDDIIHISEHFGTDESIIANEVIKLYDIVKN